jgi:hypothetical protein
VFKAVCDMTLLYYGILSPQVRCSVLTPAPRRTGYEREYRRFITFAWHCKREQHRHYYLDRLLSLAHTKLRVKEHMSYMHT